MMGLLFGREVFFYGDIISIFLPFKQWFFANIRQGIFPLWNPYIFSGYPAFADMTLGTFYPPSWILFFNDSVKTVSLLMIAHFFIAGYFTYRLGKLLKLSRLASFFAAVIYTFSGIMINYVADPQRFFVISLFPLFFYALFRGRIILIAAALALQLFAGHIQYVFIEVLAAMLLVKRFRVLAAAVILASLFAAVSLLPTLEFIPSTTRPQAYQDLSIYQNFSLHPATLIRFGLAHFWGIKNQGSAWGTLDTSSIGYIGFLPLLLILFNLRRLNLKSLFLAAVSLLISFGTYLPFFKIFITYIPIFRLFRNPMAWLSLYTFFMAVLAGSALDRWKFRSSRIFWLAAVLSAASLTTINFNPVLPHQFLTGLAGLINKTLSQFHTLDRDFQIAVMILNNLLLVCLLAGMALWRKNKPLLVFLTIVDLFIFTRSNVYTIDKKFFAPANPAAEWLKQNLGSYRFLSTSEAVPYSGLNDFYGMLDTRPVSREEVGKRLSAELKLLPLNFGMVYGLPSINGYTSLVIKKYNDLFQDGEELNPLFRPFLEFNQAVGRRGSDLALSKIDFARTGPDDPLLDQLAVKYLITDRDLGLPWEQAYENEGISIYENADVLPRAVVLNKEGKTVARAEIIDYGPNKIRASVPAAGKLVLYDTYYPGWTARADGREIVVENYDEVFRAVTVAEPGLVEFAFRPRSFYLGLWVSLLSLSLVALRRPIWFWACKNFSALKPARI